jgi:pyruvate,water dikinase
VVNDESYNGFRKDAIDFLYSFGHLSDNGHDFSTMPWREDADRILQLVIQYQPRSKHKGEDPDNRLEFDSLAIPWYHRSILKPVFRRAARFRQLREHISFVYTYGVSQFRVYFMELARRFTQQGLLDQPEDIFYLEYADIRQMVASGGDARAICEKIATHKQEMERARDISVPLIIYGDQAPPIDATYQQKLHGTPTAPGYHTARVKVLHGLTDFSKIEPGDILVIPYSDVSWTPLFARAGGIIAESGGMLSHSSIVAREYGIPAVVSVRGAMQLCDGEWVSLDGFRGEICVHAHEPGETAQPVMDFEKEK